MLPPGKGVLNWLQYDMSFSMELIESFVLGVEKQAAESLDNYKKHKEMYIEEIPPEDGGAHVVEIHQGLDNETWNVETIFGNYFPNLQRCSALVTIWGYFEHELDKLCLLYQSEKSYKLALSDLTRKGIDRAVNYLQKVAGLDPHKESKEWFQLKNIQKIRNIIVHKDGKLLDHKGCPIKDVVAYVNQMDCLSGDSELMIKAGFLEHVISIMKEYFRLIEESIKNAEGGQQTSNHTNDRPITTIIC